MRTANSPTTPPITPPLRTSMPVRRRSTDTSSDSAELPSLADRSLTLHDVPRSRAQLPTYDELMLPSYVPSRLKVTKSGNNTPGYFFSFPDAHYSTFIVKLDTERVDYAFKTRKKNDFGIPAPIWEDHAPRVTLTDTKDRSVFFTMAPYLNKATGIYGYDVNNGEIRFEVNGSKDPCVMSRFRLPSTGGSFCWRGTQNYDNIGVELGYVVSLTLYLESQAESSQRPDPPPPKSKFGFGAMGKLLQAQPQVVTRTDFTGLLAVAKYETKLTHDIRDMNGELTPVIDSLDPHDFPWSTQEDCAVFIGSVIAALYGLRFTSRCVAHKVGLY
ncbi:hypothetical protein BC830DRAFT_1131628 [Chytriomyces sp. MP71]|nr:hypothetical protein BC830DRAFT_1131628 [Chytriomyces sp. MP71]